jgi:hypothetical protein
VTLLLRLLVCLNEICSAHDIKNTKHVVSQPQLPGCGPLQTRQNRNLKNTDFVDIMVSKSFA